MADAGQTQYTFPNLIVGEPYQLLALGLGDGREYETSGRAASLDFMLVPTATPTPSPTATDTPTATNTPTVTNTPDATNTPKPTKTNTPRPTNTRVTPTNTPVTPTNTPVTPTDTPTPEPYTRFRRGEGGSAVREEAIFYALENANFAAESIGCDPGFTKGPIMDRVISVELDGNTWIAVANAWFTCTWTG